jgi:acetyl-CoA carboxylase carboxyltransferase component
MRKKLKSLEKTKKGALVGGGEEKIKKHHAKGKLTARERIESILDPDSFRELSLLAGHAMGTPGDGVIVGFGTIDQRLVCIFAQDATVLGGSVGFLHGKKIYDTIKRALEMRVPCIGLWDSPGGRAMKIGDPNARDALMEGNEEGGHSIHFPVVQASSRIPQISIIMGSCAGNSVYCPALTDFVFMVDKISHMFVTGPRIVESVMGEKRTMDELGGVDVHSRVTGLCDFRASDERECLRLARRLLSYLPLNCDESPPTIESKEPKVSKQKLVEIVPAIQRKPYDMEEVIRCIVDDSDYLKVKDQFAPEMITAFARLEGHVVGIVANQPMVKAGSLTAGGSVKEARFIRFCDGFNIPLVFLIDTPAFLPGREQEHSGVITHGAKVVYALCEATVPRIVVVLRKVYGGGTLGMGFSPGLGTDFVFVWPTAELGVMGAEQSVELLYGKEISESENPDDMRALLIRKYQKAYSDPVAMASTSSHIDDVIDPRNTREHLINALRLMRKKRLLRHKTRHGNIPL